MGIIIFNGVSSEDRMIRCEEPPDYQIPERDVETVHVPGRNGDLLLDNGSYKNTTRSYKVSSGSREIPFWRLAGAIAEWVGGTVGYARLEDSYEPEYYRIAKFTSSLNITNIQQHGARASVSFDCKPQRFLKSGEKEIVIPSFPYNIANPTFWEARPLLRVKLSLQTSEDYIDISVNSYGIRIALPEEHDGGTFEFYIDSDVQEAYGVATTSENYNEFITMDKGFPRLSSGVNVISRTVSGGELIEMEVTPRWWTL